jgi:hypothetical protein
MENIGKTFSEVKRTLLQPYRIKQIDNFFFCVHDDFRTNRINLVLASKGRNLSNNLYSYEQVSRYMKKNADDIIVTDIKFY